MPQYFDRSIGDYIVSAGPIPYSVRTVTPHANFTLVVGFADGSIKSIDFKPFLQKPMYSALQDTERFLHARADHGTVDWGDDIDIAPELLYDNGVIVAG